MVLSIVLVPQIVFAQCPVVISAFPYTQGFETTPAWASGGTNNDWAWGTPAHPLINSAPEGTRAWCVGGLNGSFYANNQQSWLETPCFDLSLLTYPYISFMLYWETEPAYDGLGFQFSVNGGTTWSNLGSNTDNDCLNVNWFNSPNITALNLAAPKRGWSGTAQVGGCSTGQGSGGWVRAGHCLDGIPTGSPVKFRFVFGAGSICNTFDGIGLDDVYIGEAPPNEPQITFTCAGNTVSFSNTATLCASSSVWNFGDPGSGANNTLNAINASHTYPGPGTYPVSLTMTGPCNAPATGTMQLVIAELDIATVDPDCSGANGAATADVSGAPGPFTYVWSPGNQATQTITGLSAGNYTVTVEATDMCPLQGSATLTLGGTGVTAVETHTDVSCAGLNDGTATVTASGGSGAYSYAWAPTGGMAASATGLAAGNYTCEVSDGAGCTTTVNVTITEPGPLTLDIGPAVTICAGGTTTLEANAMGGTGAYTYAWAPAGPEVAPMATTEYSVSVTDANGCLAGPETVDVTVNGVGTPDFSVDVDRGCTPVCVTFSDLSTGAGVRSWSFGDGSTAGDEPDPVHCYIFEGQYDVTLSILDAGGCTGTTTVLNAVEAFAVPVAAFDASPTVAIIDDPVFRFTDRSIGATSWNWHFGDQTDTRDSVPSPVFTFDQIGCVTVELEVTNDAGCIDSNSAQVCVEDAFALYAPNAFTPNNDGFNDGFFVTTTVRDPKLFELSIYDRWGQPVTKIDEPFTPWVAEGVPQGVYVWKVRVRDTEGTIHERTGSVTLLR